MAWNEPGGSGNKDPWGGNKITIKVRPILMKW